MRIQRMMSNGNWADADGEGQAERIIELAIEFEAGRAARQNRAPAYTARQDVLSLLAYPYMLRFDTDWYNEVRDADAIKPSQPRPVETVRCSCGHAVAKALAMSASMGSSCPSCYDRMSS